MCREPKDWVIIGSRSGRRAGLPTSGGIRGESHTARCLRVVACGVAGPVSVRDDADRSIGSVRCAEGIRMIGEGIVPRRSLEPRLSEPEGIGA